MTEGQATPDLIDRAVGEVPWQRVAARYVWVDLTGNVLSGLIPTVVFVVLALATSAQWLWIVAAALAIITIVAAVLTPRRVRAIGYLLRSDDLLFRRGIMFRRVIAVPYGRMQLVDINRGPIARAFGLAELKLITAAAAAAITIPGLDESEAERLRDQLVALAETRRVGL